MKPLLTSEIIRLRFSNRSLFYFTARTLTRPRAVGFATFAFNNISGIGRDGTGVLILQWDETFDVGADTGTPVYDKTTRYRSSSPANFNKLTLSIERPKLTPDDNGGVPRGIAAD